MLIFSMLFTTPPNSQFTHSPTGSSLYLPWPAAGAQNMEIPTTRTPRSRNSSPNRHEFLSSNGFPTSEQADEENPAADRSNHELLANYFNWLSMLPKVPVPFSLLVFITTMGDLRVSSKSSWKTCIMKNYA